MRMNLGISAKVIHNELIDSLGEDAPSYSFVVKWIGMLKQGRENIENEPKIGRPITISNETTIAKISQMIQEDPFLSIDEISESLEIDYPIVLQISNPIFAKHKQ
ncbi:hypothetical protein ABPG72_013359 [Tetrahymena utriculariae]